MKETLLSTCEKSFILSAIAEGKRLDGRSPYECRHLRIMFGNDWGCCQVSLGETKVLAQVSCEVQAPKATRPNEGLLYINVELSPMGAPHFEPGRQSELAVQLNRLLEKCIKDSRSVDLESLCIVAEEKVWAIRVDVNVLNHEGSLVDAASVAALTAIAHFRHPDVTITGEQTIIHDPAERDPIPLSLHHHPVCVSYAIFNKGEHVVADPTAIEERVSEASLVFGVNAYRELCGLHLGGSALTKDVLVLECANKAADRAAEVVQKIKDMLAQDLEARTTEKPVGFAESIKDGKILALAHERFHLRLSSDMISERRREMAMGQGTHIYFDEENEDPEAGGASKSMEENEMHVIPLGEGSAELCPTDQISTSWNDRKPAVHQKGQKRWMKQDEDEDEDDRDKSSSGSDIEVVQEISYEEGKKIVDHIVLSEDSEEEETVTLKASELSLNKSSSTIPEKEDNEEDKSTKARGWYAQKTW